jgi:hypothetical protein
MVENAMTRCDAVAGEETFLAEHAGERDAAEAAAEIPEEVATGSGVGEQRWSVE